MSAALRIAAAAAVIATLAASQASRPAWTADLASLAKEFPARHKNAFAAVPREEFERRVASLARRIGSLDDLHAEGELACLVAGLGDSHSGVEMRALAAGPKVPLGLNWFQDGLRVLAAPKAQEAAAGKLVTKIGGVPLEQVLKRMDRIRHFDNESMRRANAPALMRLPKVLEFLGIVDDPTQVPVTLGDGFGGELAVVLRPGPMGRDAVVLQPQRPPVTAARVGKWHDHDFLDKDGILYVQYNKCASDALHDLSKFSDALVQRIDGGEVRAVVLDLQYNSGGNSMLGDEMFAKLARKGPLADKKNVFCVIGRYTFSSAILNALALRQGFGAVLVGESTGGSPNHFGEVASFELPGSKLKVSYSQKRFERAAPGTTTIEPDHRVETTFADYVAGRDPILERIRALIRP